MADGEPKDKTQKQEDPPDNAQKRVSPARRQQDAKRERDLAEFGRQVEEGSVVIRQMTPEERDANPPRERPPKRRPSR